MRFRVSRRQAADAGPSKSVRVLEDTSSGAIAEVWPTAGFNCYRWQVRGRELLYAAPDLFQGGKPTRSGIPVLFPFPNRIRDGRYSWDGREYQLPLDDPAGKNAIHGFAVRHPWRVIDEGGDDGSAWVTGEFHAWLDAPEVKKLWPADHEIRLTLRLSEDRLRLEARVRNPDGRSLPFGLGYHPYFRVSAAGDAQVHAPATARWELIETLPTGNHVAPGSADLNAWRPVRDVTLDDVLTGLPSEPVRDELVPRGAIRHEGLTLEQWASPTFRELVVFTPPHREAVCLEPYTCMTDAINLQQRGVEAGWRALPPSEAWTSVVELRLRTG
jgi:aldose 1-epimerase